MKIACLVIAFVLLLLMFYCLYEYLQKKSEKKENLLQQLSYNNKLHLKDLEKLIKLLDKRKTLYANYFSYVSIFIQAACLLCDDLLVACMDGPPMLEMLITKTSDDFVAAHHDIKLLAVKALKEKGMDDLMLGVCLLKHYGVLEMRFGQLMSCVCTVRSRYTCQKPFSQVCKQAECMLTSFYNMLEALKSEVNDRAKKRSIPSADIKIDGIILEKYGKYQQLIE